MFQKGEIVFGRYRIEALLGRGASGEVYLAEHINLNVFRALKCIDRCQDLGDMAAREADILKNLRHPAIPIIYDIEENDECVCIIEEYIEGLSLNSFITKHRCFTAGEIADIGLQLCNVTEYLHERGIFHSDIKPENIIYAEGRIYLLDYGNAQNALSREGISRGTKGYAPPEFYTGEHASRESDVYSIGAVMRALGKAGGRNMIPELDKTVSECLLHSKSERIGSVRELSKRLNKIKNRKNKSENVSLSICFVGAYPHCGVTHCAVLAGYFLVKQRFKTVVIEENFNDHFLHIIRQCDKITFKNSVYVADGLCMVPQYYGCINGEEGLLADRRIYDYGVLSPDNIEEVLKYDVVCLVTGSRPYELDKAVQILEKGYFDPSSFKGKLHTLINLSDTGHYKRIIKNPLIINPVRVGYFPEPSKIRPERIQIVRKKH
ncbi:MAG: serine/threonine protein kinase [Butyrivibrio sp.]